MIPRCSIILVVLLSSLLINGMTPVRENKIGQGMAGALLDKEFNLDISLVESFRQTKSLDGLIKAANDLEKKWRRLNQTYYARLMLHISNQLSSYDFATTEQYVFEQKYARLALEKTDGIPVDLEIRLVLHLQENLKYQKGIIRDTAWINERSEKSRLWLHAWHRLNKEINSSFNFDDEPVLSVNPPAGVRGRAGMAPEEIKNEKLRTKYEAAIAANARKAAEFNRQYRLHQLSGSFPRSAEKYLIQAYSKSPPNSQELRALLNAYQIDKNAAQRILKEVSKHSSAP